MSIPPPEMRDRVDVLRGFAEDASDRGEYLFYVRLPVSLQPMERGEQLEDPLHEALTVANLGEVAGGGPQRGENDTIAYCGIDVIVKDRDRGLEVIRSMTRKLSAPEGTVIEEFLPVWSELPL